MEPTNQQKNILPYIVIAFLSIVIVGFLGFYFWFRSTYPGFEKAGNLMIRYAGIIRSANIHQSFEGTLLEVVPGKRWTIEKEGKTITIINNGVTPINYSQSPSNRDSSPKTITETEIHKGDKLIINTITDTKTGAASVTSVFLRR